jgi:hypothetical protein
LIVARMPADELANPLDRGARVSAGQDAAGRRSD